jgi:hypothetical protein
MSTESKCFKDPSGHDWYVVPSFSGYMGEVILKCAKCGESFFNAQEFFTLKKITEFKSKGVFKQVQQIHKINESQINPGLPKEPGDTKKEMRFGPPESNPDVIILEEASDPWYVTTGSNTISDAALKVLNEMIEEAKEENKKEETKNKNYDFYIGFLLEERNELQEKIIKLREFMLTPKWDLIDATQKKLMEFQVTSMEDYHYFLRQRIALLNGE